MGKRIGVISHLAALKTTFAGGSASFCLFLGYHRENPGAIRGALPDSGGASCGEDEVREIYENLPKVLDLLH